MSKQHEIQSYTFTSKKWNENVLYEIILYFDNLKDILNLARTNSNFYNWILFNDNFQYLKHFKNIKFNEIPKIIPNYLFQLKNLTISPLNLERKEMHLNGLEKFTNLKELNLNCLTINDENLLQIKHVKSLNFSRCLFHVENLNILNENLTNLNISNTNIVDKQIEGLNNLISLNISNCNEIEGICFKNFIKLKNLTAIYATNLNVNYLTNLINLNHLNINYLRISGKIVTNLIRLKTLQLSKLTEPFEDDNYLQKLNNLEELTITEKYPHYLNNFKLPESLKKLKSCDLQENDIKNLVNLEYLYLNCYNVRFKGIYLKNLIKLNTLILLNSDIIDENLKYCYNLTNLEITDCCKINGNSFLHLTNLVKLKIDLNDASEEESENDEESDDEKNEFNIIIDESFKNLQKLQYLNITGCFYLKGDLFNYLSNLEELFLAKCDNIEGKTLSYLKKLKLLQLDKIKDDNDYLDHYIKDLNLESLQIDQCCKFSGECLQKLQKLKCFSVSNLYGNYEFIVFDGDGLNNFKNLLLNKNETFKSALEISFKLLREGNY